MIEKYLAFQGSFILDGALATELERRGFDLNDPLWSAKILLENPAAIQQLHTDYLHAGADCLISATYQATFEGFADQGFSRTGAAQLMHLAVDLALSARDEFWGVEANQQGRLKPLVAASIGPYGAFLANGAEYTGAYGMTRQELLDWHRPRWHLLAKTAADLLACETIPSRPEAQAYVQLLDEIAKPAWLTFSCGDGQHIWDGTPLAEIATEVAAHPAVVAVGVNCTAPQFIPDLIKALQAATEKPILVYPNSGEQYDPHHKRWTGRRDAQQFGTAAREWRKLGAAGIGGCCRTSPEHILAISSRLKKAV